MCIRDRLVSPQIELQEHSNPRPVVPRGIATARQRLAETLAVFPTDKSYHLLLARNGDIGEIALFDQNLAIIAQKCPVVRVDGAGEESLVEAFSATHCVFWAIRTDRKHGLLLS